MLSNARQPAPTLEALRTPVVMLALQRAVAAVGTNMIQDDDERGRAFLMSWAYLESLDADVWRRMVESDVLGDHPAILEFRVAAKAVVAEDVDGVLQHCQELARWSEKTLTRMDRPCEVGGDAERRRQQRDAQPFELGSDLLPPADLDVEVAARLLYRIGARLFVAAHKMADKDGGDLADDLATHLAKSHAEFGWWMDGSHLVLAAAEAFATHPGQRDILAEMQAIIAPLHLGFDSESGMLTRHVRLAGERHLEVLSAAERWLEDPDAPVTWDVSATVREQWQSDIDAILSGEAEDPAEVAGALLAEAGEWEAEFSKLAKTMEPRGLLTLLDAGAGPLFLAPVGAPPEVYGTALTIQRRFVQFAGATGNELGLDPQMVIMAAVIGRAHELADAATAPAPTSTVPEESPADAMRAFMERQAEQTTEAGASSRATQPASIPDAPDFEVEAPKDWTLVWVMLAVVGVVLGWIVLFG